MLGTISKHKFQTYSEDAQGWSFPHEDVQEKSIWGPSEAQNLSPTRSCFWEPLHLLFREGATEGEEKREREREEETEGETRGKKDREGG